MHSQQNIKYFKTFFSTRQALVWATFALASR